MTTTRDDAEAAPSRSVPLDDRSMVPSIMGLRWWATLLIALVLAAAGVAADILRTGQLGLIYTICFPVGCVLAAVWARRSQLFGPMVQPPLLLVVAVPVVVAATGSLPRSGGLASTVIAVGGPLINGFPVMAITTAVVLAVGFVRWKIQPTSRSEASRPPGPSAGQKARGGGQGGGQGGGRGGGARPQLEKGRAEGRRPADREARDARDPGVYRVGRAGDAERVERARRPERPGR